MRPRGKTFWVSELLKLRDQLEPKRSDASADRVGGLGLWARARLSDCCKGLPGAASVVGWCNAPGPR